MTETLKKRLSIAHNIVLILVVFFVLLTAALYQNEKGSVAADYVSYFGNVPTNNSYVWPAPAAFYAFGEFVDRDEGRMTFINTMWCKPVGHDVSPNIVETRVVTYDHYKFVNDPPAVSKIRLTNDLRSFFSFGVTEQELIRSLADDNHYLEWNMGGIAPREDSTCYVTADIITYTPIFNLPKSTTYRGGEFTYFISENR